MPRPKLTSDLDQFISKVDRTTTPDGCWLWAGTIGTVGYGQMRTGSKAQGNVRTTLAHRFALELALGRPLAPGVWALHTCDVPLCVRNDPPGTYLLNGIERPRFGHLWAGSTQDNTADRHAKGRSAPGGDLHWTRLRPESLARGSRHFNAAFTEAQVVEVRLRWAAGERQIDLAREFNVTPHQMCAVINRRSWRHV